MEEITGWKQDPEPKPLAVGYSGEIYKVHDGQGKGFACKEYKEYMKPFFKAEKTVYEMLDSYNSPNFIKVVDSYDIDTKNKFLIMEEVKGQSLK